MYFLRAGHAFFTEKLLTTLSQGKFPAALNRALSHLEILGTSQATQHDRAMIYLASLLFHRRAPEEHAELIQIVNQQTRNPEVNDLC